MASNEMTIDINVPHAPFETPDLDDEESFIVLGQSPSSFSLDEQSNAYSILQDALKSIDLTLSATQNNESSVKTENDEKELDTLKESLTNLNIDEPKATSLHMQDKNLSLVTVVSDLSVEEIQSKVESIVEENNRLKETIVQNNVAMKKQYDTIMQWQEEVQKVHNLHKEKFNKTRQYIEELQQEIIKLNEGLKESQLKIDELNAKLLSHTDVANSSQNNVLQFELCAARKKNEALEKSLLEKKEQNDRMRMNYEAKLNGMENKVDYLKNKCENMQEENRVAKNEELENIRQQLMNAQMHITELEQAGAKYRDLINEQQKEIAELKMKSAVNNPVTDEIPVLRAQLDIFKADFEAEVNAKQMYISRSKQLAEDLANLQRRNHQLIEEVDRLRGNDFVHVEQPTPQQSEFICPKCNFKFANYPTLENHVFRCIELDSLS